MIKWPLIVLGVLLAGVGLVRTVAGQATPVPEKPTTAVANCTQGNCHAKQVAAKVLHGPTALRACDACHIPTDEKLHTFHLKQEGKALCDFCHAEKKVNGPVVHKPVEEGKCLGCHDPHGAGTKLLLKKDDLGTLCRDCHKDLTKDKPILHGPVGAGSCTACHNAHSADLPKLLVAQGRDLCLSCHEQMAVAIRDSKVIHKPVATGDCTQCHEVHASAQPMQLKLATVELCESCHKPIKEAAANARFKHSAVEQGAACLNCHTSHASQTEKLTRKDLPRACLTCHDKAQKTADGRTVAAVPEVTSPDLSLHGPIREGNCAGCHVLHGSEVSRLLAKPYPETFYENFNADKYALCFTCHDKSLVLEAKSTGLTRFRNGNDNLHFLHVNRTEKGRSCRGCHATHASKYALHVRETVPYGKWEMPLNFQATSTGGSCTPGCHKEVRYDRDNPIAYDHSNTPPAPAAPPAVTPPAPSQPTPAQPAPTPAAPAQPATPAPAPTSPPPGQSSAQLP
jgi:predicted CXXCH cytochrome family protein